MNMASGYRRALDDTIPLSCVIEGFLVKDGHTVCSLPQFGFLSFHSYLPLTTICIIIQPGHVLIIVL